ncbi:MAG: long-chain fatty acid--CoA ligase [Rhizobacter sp.]
MATSQLPVLQQIAHIRTLPELFSYRVAHSGGDEGYRQFDATSGLWQSVTYSQAGDHVRRWGLALQGMGLPRQATVAVLLPNGLPAVWIDQAAMAMACVPVPLHVLDNPGSIAYILSDCEAALLFVQQQSQWAAIAATGVPLPNLRQVVVADNQVTQEAGVGASILVSLEDWLAQAERSKATQPVASPLESELACIVYTSGTTGKPKGVMLTHANVLSNVKAIQAHVVTWPSDVYLSFLPLSHTFERTAGYYSPLAAGSCVAYARSVPLLAEDLRIVRPTVLVSVPRIYERVYAQVEQMLAGSPIKAFLFASAVSVGWRRFCAKQGLPVGERERSVWSWADALMWPLLDHLVAKPLRERFGGRVRAAVSGGAALSGVVARCFLGLGLPVLQGYGMTETSPVVTSNTPEHNDPSTVGTLLSGVEVKLGDNQELLVRGPNVMKGYWKRPEDTARTMLPDGWLRTGDQAGIEHGRVRILGRIKEIIVTSTGEKIAPGDLELAITTDPMFEQAFVVGENRPFIAAVVVLNAAHWKELAAHLGLDPADPASLQQAQAQAAALKQIVAQTADFPRYGVPKAVLLTLEPWTLENTFMTPTLKLKRNNLMAYFADGVEKLYQAR